MQNCYTQERMQRELHDQDERLTSKHINTLKFLQDTVSENKKLKVKIETLEEKLAKCADLHDFAEHGKEKIKEIQEQYLNRADEINQMLVKKHTCEVMKKVEENIQAEKTWAEEKLKLLAEIDKLRKENEDLKKTLEEYCQDKNMVEMLEQKLKSLREEFTDVESQKDKLDVMSRKQRDEILRLEFVDERNKSLTDELSWANQKAAELELKIRKLETELTNAAFEEQEEVMDALKRKLTKLYKEKASLEETDKKRVQNVSELTSEIETLRRALNDSERMRRELQAQMGTLQKEITSQHHQNSASEKERLTFKDFVQLKRELAAVKEENEDLRIQMKLSGSQRNKKDGGFQRLKADAAVLPRLVSAGSKGGRKSSSETSVQYRK